MRRKGFTIVEILLVILMISLAGTLAAFDVYRDLDSTVLRSGALGLQRMARYGRLLAGQNHQACRLHLNLREGTYWLTVQKRGMPVAADNEPTEEEPFLPVENVYPQIKKLPEKLYFNLVKVEDTIAARDQEEEISVGFNVDGSAQAGLIQISNTSATQTLLIYPCTARTQLYNEAINELPSEIIDLEARD